MDILRAQRILPCVHADDKPKLRGIGHDPLIADIVKIHALVVRVELNAFDAHGIYFPQLFFIVLRRGMDAAKGYDLPFLEMRRVFVDSIEL